MKAVGALGGLSLVFGAAGQLIRTRMRLIIGTLSSTSTSPSASHVSLTSLASIQRATQGAGQSTSGGGHNVIERGGVVREEPEREAVMIAHLVVGPENDGFGLDRQVGPPDRASIANDPELRYVFSAGPRLLNHLGFRTHSRPTRIAVTKE